MLNVDIAIQKLAAMIAPLPGTEVVDVADSVGRTAAREVTTPISLPPFDSSAMDGYAIACNASGEVAPGSYQVVGTSAAGHPFDEALRAGECVRIFTGAAIPEGGEAVVLQEDIERKDDHIDFEEQISPGDNIRYAGLDIAAGAALIDAGTTVSPFARGWFAACGITQVEVTRKVRVALFSTGDELVEAGRNLEHGQIYDSNRESLKALVDRSAVEIQDLGCLPDDFDATKETLDQTAKKADVIVTSGGVSVGDSDFVRPAVEALGSLEFWNIALKPGKPLAVGRIGDALFFGLPGNPVSTIVTYMLFVEPAISRLSGAAWPEPQKFDAVLEGEIRHRQGRREYQRGFMRTVNAKLHVSPTGDQSSNRLATFHGCNCIIVVPETRDDLTTGTNVEILLLKNGSLL